MNNKKMYQNLGVFLVIAGIFIIINQPFAQITGAVIDISTASSRIWFFVGLGSIIGGVILNLNNKLEELLLETSGQVTAQEFVDRIKNAGGEDNKNKSVILDTSAIRAYSPQEFRYILDNLEEVILPNKVYDELPAEYKAMTKGKRNIKRFNSTPKFNRIARSYLEKTEKAQMYEALVPILDDILTLKRTFEQLTPQERQILSTKTEKLKKLAERDNFDMRGRGMKGLEQTRYYLEDHCKISDADVAVLGSALYQIRHHNYSVIGERDTDFREAIDMIKLGKRTNPNNLKLRENSKIAANLEYVEPYQKRETGVV